MVFFWDLFCGVNVCESRDMRGRSKTGDALERVPTESALSSTDLCSVSGKTSPGALLQFPQGLIALARALGRSAARDAFSPTEEQRTKRCDQEP
jgi:hypothetical protein